MGLMICKATASVCIRMCATLTQSDEQVRRLYWTISKLFMAIDGRLFLAHFPHIEKNGFYNAFP